MYPVVPSRECLAALADLDRRLAASVRSRGCPRCGGPLHTADWRRKPRGAELPEELTIRHGLCCGHCRRRTLPDSVLFHGRRVYLKAVVLMAVAARQPDRRTTTLRRLAELFGVARQTVRRWLCAYLDRLATHPGWRRVRGRVPPTVRDADVPAGLLELLGDALGRTEALNICCQWVPPL